MSLNGKLKHFWFGVLLVILQIVDHYNEHCSLSNQIQIKWDLQSILEILKNLRTEWGNMDEDMKVAPITRENKVIQLERVAWNFVQYF